MARLTDTGTDGGTCATDEAVGELSMSLMADTEIKPVSRARALNAQSQRRRLRSENRTALSPADQLKLRLDLMKLRRDMGDSLGVARYDDEFGLSLRASQDPEISEDYASLIASMAEEIAVARRDGRSPNMNWDHHFVRRLIADGLMDPKA